MYLKIINEIGKIDELPTIPPVLLEINKVLADPSSSAKDVANFIEKDQVLTTRILKLVNSAYYGYPAQITKLSQAVVILGYREVKNLILSSKTFDLFKSCYKKFSHIFDISLLWKHSLGTAVISRRIGSIINYQDLETLFVAGLLHDIGKVVEFKCLTDDMPKIFRLIKESNYYMWKAEQELWSVTHAEIGKALVDMWDFPPLLEQTIAYHHYPHLAKKFRKETLIVHIANSLCCEMSIGSGGDDLIPEVEQGAWENVDLELKSHKDEIFEKTYKDVDMLLPIFS